MARVKRGVAAHKKHKKLLKSAEGRRASKHKLIRPAREAALHAIPHEREAVGAGPAGRRTLCASGPAQIDFIVDLAGEAVQGVDGAALGPGQSHEAPVEVGGLAAGQFLAILFVRAQRGRAATPHPRIPPLARGDLEKHPQRAGNRSRAEAF